MGVELRPLTAVVILALVLAVGSIGSVVVTENVGEEYDPTNEVVDLPHEEQAIWLYTSRGQSFSQGTLAVNVVVYEKPSTVERHLFDEGVGNWEEVEEDEQDIGHEDGTSLSENATIQWDRTVGDTRHVFLFGPNAQWMTQSFEVHDGDYLGSRHHIRVYEPPNDAEWTAMQAHSEYWDLFDARHVVTSVKDGQSYVEQEYLGDDDYRVVRDHVGGEDLSDFDGWLTVVKPEDSVQSSLFALGVLLLGASAARTTRDEVADAVEEFSLDHQARTFVLGASLIAVYMFVRLASVGLERTVDLSPNTIALLLYPVLFAGLPITAYLLASPLERTWAFTGASLGFLTALLIDYTYLGVTAVPLDILVHRGALIIALGLIAVGGSRTERENPNLTSRVQVGVLLWVVSTVLPLLKHTPLPV
jgi:hypothetical protein